MVSPDTAEGVAGGFLSVLPPEIAKDLVFIVQAIGGLFILYLIFLGVRLYFIRKQTKMIEEMKEDIKKIKRKVYKKN